MNIDLVKYNGETLPDIVNAVFVTQHKMGSHKINRLNVGIFDFNKQKFMSNGEVHENVVAYGTYDINEIQKINQ